MAEVTPNLGLKKPLESEFVSIQTLNENMDKVDQSLGPVEDLPTTAKNAAGAISEIYDQLTDKPHEQLTLTPGVQVVQGGDVPAILRSTMQGRTLVNLLGRDGNCESLGEWQVVATSGTPSYALDITYKFIGRAAIGVQGTGVNSSIFMYRTVPLALNTDKNYLVVGHARSMLPTTITVGTSAGLANGGTITNSVSGDAATWNMMYKAFKPATTSPLYISGNVEGNATMAPAAGFDGFRLYEITAAEKTYIDSLTTTAAQTYIAANYPYVDDMKHVNAVYLENKGKNLLPPFSEWNVDGNGAVVVIDPYSLRLNAVTANEYRSIVDVKCLPNTQYTLSINITGGAIPYVLELDRNGVAIVEQFFSSSKKSFTTNEKSVSLQIFAFNTTGSTGTFTFSNPMLNLGSESLPFESQKPSYLYLPGCNLRSNEDGSVADRLYTDGQGKLRVTRRFREVVLDDSINAIFGADYSGFKVVILDMAKDAIANTGTIVKYDGRVFKTQASNVTFTVADQAWNGNVSTGFVGNEVAISIANTDSGWGDSYTPTAEEIKAYFYGWRMYTVGGGVYNGTGDKLWARIWVNSTQGDRDLGVTWAVAGSGTLVLPKMLSAGFTPYRLMFQLAHSVDESVTYEGSLMLHEGVNQVEVGTGVVVREASKPFNNGIDDFMRINNNAYPESYLSRQADVIRTVYRGDRLDKSWTIDGLVAYGNSRAVVPKTHYDSTLAYSVTYLALDTYTLGVAPQTISAEYAPNIRESIESLVREVVEARTETSVLQNTKAQKNPSQWIEPTLLNEWVRYNSNYATASYYKDDSSIVRIRGLIKGGVTAANTVLFYLPAGYRPSFNVSIVGVYGAAFSPVQLVVTLDGAVLLGGIISSNSFINIDGSFRAEQ